MTQEESPNPLDEAVSVALGPYYRLVESVLDSLGVAVIACHQDGRIFLVNKEAEFLTGYSRTELHGETIERLVPDGVREVHPAHRAQYTREPRTRPMGEGLDLHLKCKDGRLEPVVVTLGSFMSDERVVTTATIQRKPG